MELISLQLFDAVAFQVKNFQGCKPVECVILHTRDQGIIEVEGLEIFPPCKMKKKMLEA